MPRVGISVTISAKRQKVNSNPPIILTGKDSIELEDTLKDDFPSKELAEKSLTGTLTFGSSFACRI